MLAARLAAGDHLALAEAFDRLAPAVYSGALRLSGTMRPRKTSCKTCSSSCGPIRAAMTRMPGRCAAI